MALFQNLEGLCCEFSNRVYHKLCTTSFPTTETYNSIGSAQAAGFLALQPGLAAILQCHKECTSERGISITKKCSSGALCRPVLTIGE